MESCVYNFPLKSLPFASHGHVWTTTTLLPYITPSTLLLLEAFKFDNIRKKKEIS